VMLSLSSQWDNGVINQGQIYGQKRTNDTDPFLRYPQGTIRVTSLLDDGTTGVSSLSFGGNAAMPTNSLSNLVEFSDELSYLSAAHRIKLGTLVNVTGNDNDLRHQSERVRSVSTHSPISRTACPRRTPGSSRRTKQAGDAINAAIYAGELAQVARVAVRLWRSSRGFALRRTAQLQRAGRQRLRPPH